MECAYSHGLTFINNIWQKINFKIQAKRWPAYLVFKQEISKPKQDTGCREVNGEAWCWDFVCNLIFCQWCRGSGWWEMILRCVLCRGGDRKSESLVLTLKAACPGLWHPLGSSWPWRLWKGEEDQSRKGDLNALHQSPAFILFTRGFWLPAAAAHVAFISRCNSLLQLFKFWWR